MSPALRILRFTFFFIVLMGYSSVLRASHAVFAGEPPYFNNRPVVRFFSASWCSACHRLYDTLSAAGMGAGMVTTVEGCSAYVPILREEMPASPADRRALGITSTALPQLVITLGSRHAAISVTGDSGADTVVRAIQRTVSGWASHLRYSCVAGENDPARDEARARDAAVRSAESTISSSDPGCSGEGGMCEPPPEHSVGEGAH